MNISKFKTTLVVIILSISLILASAMAQITTYYTISSSGSIGSPVTPTASSYESEIRAVLVHGQSMAPEPDFGLICDTLMNYGINTLVVELLYPHGSRYPSSVVPSYTADLLTPAINSAHDRGIKIVASFNVLLGAYSDSHKVETSAGTLSYWTSPVRSASRTHIEALTRELASFQSQFGSHAGDTIDGFMFDYIRYHESADNRDYSSEARAAFENWLGEGPISDWTPFYYGGLRYDEYLEWGVITINDLVRDMRTWILEENPDMEISAAVWTPVMSDNPTLNRKDLGQDSAYWISQGWLDWVAPMLYVGAGDTAFLAGLIQQIQQYANGGPEGKIPVAPFITHSFMSKTPAQFKAEIDTLRANGADGWVIWEYGGPGDFANIGPDIRDYLNVMSLPQTFWLRDIEFHPNLENATVTWTTTMTTTSKVEYSTSPLFNASYEIQTYYNFHYWDIDHVEGTIIEDATPVTNHMMTLTGLQEGIPYYYRVQSQDSSGIATSQVSTFTP